MRCCVICCAVVLYFEFAAVNSNIVCRHIEAMRTVQHCFLWGPYWQASCVYHVTCRRQWAQR